MPFQFCVCENLFGPIPGSYIQCILNVFLFSHVQAELYEDYKDRRYGPDAAPFAVDNSDSDAEIIRPGSKLDSPGAYDC